MKIIELNKYAAKNKRQVTITPHIGGMTKEAQNIAYHSVSKKLTLSSQNEQKSAGLDQCSDEEFSILSEYNKLYREKFKFPFIIAVSGLNRSQIINQIKTRF